MDFTVSQNPKLSKLKMNGICDKVEKFKSTMHVSCLFGRDRYIAEFMALGHELTLNRYYTDLEVASAKVGRRIGSSTLAIVGDEELRITNYGANRNTLLKLNHRQPSFNFNFPNGADLLPLDSFRYKHIHYLGVAGDELQFIQVARSAAQLVCDFNNEEVGMVYSLLVTLTASQCSYVKNEETVMTGSI